MVLPSIAGWGPREGATAWVFAAAGLGAAQGAATAVVYGVMVLAASLPGAVVLVVGWLPPDSARTGLSAGRSRRCVSAPTRCSPAACRSTATSAAPPPGCCLSNDADFDRVDAVRASCDAILVGAETVRIDNPRLVVRSQTRRAERAARGLPASPIKVTVTRRAELDACADFFRTGDAEKLVYCASPRVADARERLGPVATVVDGGSESVEMRTLSTDLAARGVERLMVEGGGTVHTQFLTEDIVDELQLTVAPVFVGDSEAPRFVRDGIFPWNPGRRAELVDVRQLGDVVLLRYALSSRFEESEQRVPTATIRTQVELPLRFADGYDDRRTRLQLRRARRRTASTSPSRSATASAPLTRRRQPRARSSVRTASA